MSLQSFQSIQGAYSRQTYVSVEARHPSRAHSSKGFQHDKQTGKKKRDISTSFRRGPVPRPLTQLQQQDQQEERLIGIPPPAAVSPPSSLSASAQPKLQAWLPGQLATSTPGLTLGEPCGMSRAFSEPVIAACSATLLADFPTQLGPPATQQPGTGLQQPLLPTTFEQDPTSGAAAGLFEPLAWGDALDPLASLDRVLDNLIVAPSLPSSAARQSGSKSRPSPSKSSSKASNRKSTSASKVSNTPAAAAAAPPTGSSKAAGMLNRGRLAAAAVPGPAVTVIHCETDFDRELAAAAAAQQLLVVKVESNQHLLQGGFDASLRFQTHTNLPTALNTYLQHADFNRGLTGAAPGSSSSAGLVGNTSDVLHSMGFPVGHSAATAASSSSSPIGSSLFTSSSGSSSEPFSPVHAWYKQLAASYASNSAAAGVSSPVRFVSLQSDSPRAKTVCRRLGVSSGLSVVLVDAATGRKLQEYCGTKIEQELPNGLLYFGGCDPQGVRPADRLKQLNSEADLEALRSAAGFSVVAFHVHAAPPCIRSYARMHGVAQQASSAAVAFGVVDIASSDECAAVASKLDVQQLPTYIIYHNDEEVQRLSSSPDRRRLGEVLEQHITAACNKQQQQPAVPVSNGSSSAA